MDFQSSQTIHVHAASIHEAMSKLLEVNVEMAHGVANEFDTYTIT